MLGRILKFLGGYFQLYMLEEGHKYYLGGQNYKKYIYFRKNFKIFGGTFFSPTLQAGSPLRISRHQSIV
jgi:hypothetical protein